jgi:predicted HTH domain antitoxin
VSYVTISFRPSKKVADEFIHLMREEELKKSDAARDVFTLGLRSWREQRALREFQEGKLSFLAAAERAGLTAYEFLELVKSRKIAFVHVSEPELERELELAAR